MNSLDDSYQIDAIICIVHDILDDIENIEDSKRYSDVYRSYVINLSVSVDEIQDEKIFDDPLVAVYELKNYNFDFPSKDVDLIYGFGKWVIRLQIIRKEDWE